MRHCLHTQHQWQCFGRPTKLICLFKLLVKVGLFGCLFVFHACDVRAVLQQLLWALKRLLMQLFGLICVNLTRVKQINCYAMNSWTSDSWIICCHQTAVWIMVIPVLYAIKCCALHDIMSHHMTHCSHILRHLQNKENSCSV